MLHPVLWILFCGISQYLLGTGLWSQTLSGFNQPLPCYSGAGHHIPGKGQKILLWPLFGFSYPDSPFKIPIHPQTPQTGTFKLLDILENSIFLFEASMKHEKTFKLDGSPQTLNISGRNQILDILRNVCIKFKFSSSNSWHSKTFQCQRWYLSQASQAALV